MPAGAVVDKDSGNIRFFLATAIAAEPLADMEDNAQVALACGSPLNHAAYQIKGRYLSSRPANDVELAIIMIWRKKLIAALIDFGLPEPMAQQFVLGFAWQPATAVTFRPVQVFDQTPGPGAGKLVLDLEDAS
jgi:hypothetical protein